MKQAARPPMREMTRPMSGMKRARMRVRKNQMTVCSRRRLRSRTTSTSTCSPRKRSHRPSSTALLTHNQTHKHTPHPQIQQMCVFPRSTFWEENEKCVYLCECMIQCICVCICQEGKSEYICNLFCVCVALFM